MSTPSATSLPFTDAIDFFRNKLGNLLPSRTWTDTYGRVNSVGFAVAGAWKEALLADLGQAVLKAMQDGSTVPEFQKEFEAIAARHQWAYKGKPAWRAAVILNTNLRSAYAAGKWQQIQQTKATRPYLRYVAVLDARTRPLHRKWHGTILPVDHPWWKTHYPPCGWNCRCTVMSLSERDLRRNNWFVSDDPDVGLVPREVDPRRGVAIKAVPAGIDPGFEHNPGAVLETPLIPQLVADREQGFVAPIVQGASPSPFAPPATQVPSLPPARTVSSDRLLPSDTTPQAAVGQLMEQLGATADRPAAIDDHAGARMLIGPQMFTAPTGGISLGPDLQVRHVPLLGELLTDPDEVWVALDPGAPGGPAIRRRMLARMTLEGTGEQVLVVIEIVGGRAMVARVLPITSGGEGVAAAYFDARATYGLRLYARDA